MMGRTGPVFRQPGRQFDEELAREEGAEVVLQVNGKVRSKITVPFGTSRKNWSACLADDKMQPFIFRVSNRENHRRSRQTGERCQSRGR